MDSWILGLIVVAVIGVAVIVYGAVSDRRRRQHALDQLASPPKRDIPRFSPDSPAPHYLNDLEAHRPPENAPSTDLTEDQRTELAALIKDPATITLPVRRASAHFVTDKASGWAVLDTPRVLLCADPLHSVRELLGVLERTIAARGSLVIMAPEFAEDVRRTLEVNQIRRMLGVLAVIGDAEALAAAAQATGATVTPVGDLRAGYVPDDALGRCARWIAEARASHVVLASAD
ncbi:hypothetical protein [Microlunatus parietis]|uniref:Uncharacterized protein n=1 Tax=Microlunatus parietis TaxID=682979 RepID=A0A7Y9IA15_9ACTN|nr:hypothetical protein [Microlunatus parietis]NYE72892.1 hypothetical protein [Microlunatus parietis]